MKIPVNTTPTAQSNDSRKLRIRIILVALSCITALSVGLNIYLAAKTRPVKKTFVPEKHHADTPSANYMREQQKFNHLIHPLLLVDANPESPDLSPLKWEVTRTIKEWEKDGNITSVSVYLASLNNMNWIGIGSEQQYLPGSLMKVPILIYYLKQEQDHPGTLNEEFLYQPPAGGFPAQNYPGDSIKPGRKYKVSELLRYMIAESDNHATYALSQHLDREKYQHIFIDLDLPPYEENNLAYTLSPLQYSRFFRVLYSATYLNEKFSEFALELLSSCNFRDGLVRDIPKGTVVAHKFGERGINFDMNFSESAIVYYRSNPYLLTVMTKGRDIKLQTALVSEISREIYRRYGDI